MKIFNWNGIQCYYDEKDRLIHAHVKHELYVDITYNAHADGKGIDASIYYGEYDYAATSYYADGTACKYSVIGGDDIFWYANMTPCVIKYGEEVTVKALCDIADPRNMDLEYYA